jgi:ferredoxin-NADP reductase
MANKVKLKNMKMSDFSNLVKRRDIVIDASLLGEPRTKFPVNELAKALHPRVQELIIDKVTVLNETAKKFTLVANKEKGTGKLAYFQAGQYLNVNLEFDGTKLSKPYSLCSSPKDALNGFYEITVKRTSDGFASDYILDFWEEGKEISASAPNGDFKYNRLRDAKQVIGIAGGSGITPFRALARAIAEGTEDFNLTIIYGSRSVNDILFKEEFDRLAETCDNIEVIHVLSHEKHADHEHGFITEDIIKKYIKVEEYSIFVCGPPIIYKFVDQEISKLGIEQKYIRHELFGEPKNPSENKDYAKEGIKEQYQLTVRVRGEEQVITCDSNVTLLVSMEKAGIKAPSKCRSGECGFCRSRLIAGTYYCNENIDGRRMADLVYGYIHPCCTFPTSDMVIDVPV